MTLNSNAQFKDTSKWKALFALGLNYPTTDGFVKGHLPCGQFGYAPKKIKLLLFPDELYFLCSDIYISAIQINAVELTHWNVGVHGTINLVNIKRISS